MKRQNIKKHLKPLECTAHLKHFRTKSIRTRLILIMIALLGMSILLIWFMNEVFLPGYYQYTKISMLEECYAKANKIVNQDEDYNSDADGLSDNSTLELEILSANNASNVYVFRMAYNIFGEILYTYDYPASDKITDFQKNRVMEKTIDYILGMEANKSFYTKSEGRELLKDNGNYSVCKVLDKRIGSYYLEIFGRLDKGSFIYVNTNYQSMKENINVFNSFIFYVGLGVILFSAVIMVFVSNSFTKPVVKLTEIAKRMSELDFEVRYPVTSHDEIGVLGNSINTLSETLEKTISELKSANNELQRDIEEKTQIDEMRKEFLSNVSHELKTPIALIQGYAEGLYDNINDDIDSREFYCEVIIDEARKMNNMVKKLLALNQIEFGKNQVSFDRFDITEVVCQVINSASILAGQKGAVINKPECGPVYVWADEYMVEEVVTNYVSNALNHVAGEMRIDARIEKLGDVVRVSVFNTGRCIPEDELDKIWIKFYKVDKARTREYGGSGIGLSIVKAVMNSMNKQCGVKNHDDGVEFWFELDIKNG